MIPAVDHLKVPVSTKTLKLAGVKGGTELPKICCTYQDVITSYSIHYTKLYDCFAKRLRSGGYPQGKEPGRLFSVYSLWANKESKSSFGGETPRFLDQSRCLLRKNVGLGEFFLITPAVPVFCSIIYSKYDNH